MNKQNKKMAQEKRKAIREKEQKKAKVVKQLKFWVPVVAVVVIVVVLIWAVATPGASSSDNSTQDTGNATETTTSENVSDTESSQEDTSSQQSLNTEAGTVAEDGDTVNIDYTGYIDGEKFDGGSTDGNGADLTLGSGQYIDGFEDGVVGHTVGETFDLNLKFPDNYFNTEYAGKDVTFEVTLNGIYE